MDTVGIGLVGPFIALASNPKMVQANSWINWIYIKLNLASEFQFISIFGLFIVVIFYIKSFLNFRVQKYIFKFSYQQKGELSLRLMRAYLAAPYTFHLKRNTALLVQNITAETNSFCNGIMLPLLNSFSYITIVIFLSILLISTNASATAFILAILFIPFLLYRQSRSKLTEWGKEISEAQTEIICTINHSLGGLKETKVIGCEPYFEHQLEVNTQKLEKSLSSSQVFKLLPRLLIEAILITFLVGVTSLTLLISAETQNLIGSLSIFAVASIRLIPAASQITNSVASLRHYSYTLNKLYFDLKEIEGLQHDQYRGEVLHSDSKNKFIYQREHASAMPFKYQINLNQVTYSYPESEETVLKDVCLTIKKGQSIALIGKSGAGKTTLVDVVLGLLIPQSGDITVDGESIYSNLSSWQRLIGYIPQSIFLMDDTIEKNIAFGVPEHSIDSERLEKAIRAAQLSELITELPQGIKTPVGERGVRLSGGQRQRVGIARALYHEREILVLDEATSALDNETEASVNQAIKSLSGMKTLIIIAHRLTTVEHCNCIYVIEKGKIVRSGTYEEVVLRK
jgi:ABC-type multidrug transport system fused ATPase/permease subunit